MTRCSNCLLPIPVSGKKYVGTICKCSSPKALVLPKSIITGGS